MIPAFVCYVEFLKKYIRSSLRVAGVSPYCSQLQNGNGAHSAGCEGGAPPALRALGD